MILIKNSVRVDNKLVLVADGVIHQPGCLEMAENAIPMTYISALAAGNQPCPVCKGGV